MIRRFVVTVFVGLSCIRCFSSAQNSSISEERFSPATHEAEARSRAMLLHEMTHGTVQIMHRDFFDDEDTRAIPSASIEDVFHEMEKGFGVQMKWLTVNTDVVNFEHQAKTDFEKHAVKDLTDGRPYAEEITADRYQFAGAIRLRSQCLKCHVKLRTNNEDRTAALLISMPLSRAN